MIMEKFHIKTVNNVSVPEENPENVE